MSDQSNPRAVIGDNQPDLSGSSTLNRLSEDYAELSRSAALLLETARSLGETIENERELEGFSNVVVSMRDAIARAEAARAAEKEPFLRGGQAVDGWFGNLKERLGKGMNVLQRRINDYQNRKLAEERERRRLEQQQREREAREAREREERLRREAEERRLAAERARKEETRAAKGEAASAAEQEAAAAAAAASTAADAAEEARIESLRKPSEMARSRFDEGRLVTMREVGFADIVDPDKLDAVALWPFVNVKAKEVALRAWAKANGYSRAMPGAEIGKRDEAVVR